MATAAGTRGITEDTITFGQIACFTGPADHWGIRYRAGIEAAFREQNEYGGVADRLLKLISFDDAYEPARSGEAAARMLAEDDVFIVVGGTGTPTAKRLAPILLRAEVPFVGILSGAGFLRNFARYPNVVNLRASYYEEVEALVNYMVRELGARRFGVVYQEDEYGRSALRAYQSVLAQHGLFVMAKSTYTRNTHAVHSSLFTFGKADLDAVLLAGSVAASANAINLSASFGHNYILAILTFVSSHDLHERLDTARLARILVSEIVPDPADATLEIVRSFRSAISGAEQLYEIRGGLIDLKDTHAQYTMVLEEDSVALEGYIIGRFVIDVLHRLDGNLTRKAFLAEALKPDAVNIDDWRIAIKAGTNAGTSFVRLINLAGETLSIEGLQ
ncbi:MAG: ABC transporter substrate-binding protein [Bryobacterales bacterium]|nr:ABC transporter substrate-binding protein [Bryobacterales bacterium]